MSTGESLESVIGRAREREKNYDWMSAVQLYRSALSAVPEQDALTAGEIHEWVGYGFFRAACQADSVEEFRKRMQMSVESYEKAAELFDRAESARCLYCRAMARYSDFWAVEDPSQKKELLDDCSRLLKEALEGFDAAGDQLGYGKAFRILSFCLWSRIILEGDWRECKRIAEEVILYSRNAIARLSQVGDISELAWAYTMTSLCVLFYLDLFEERKTELTSMISSYSERALELSEKIEDGYFLAFLYYTLCVTSFLVKGDVRDASRHTEKLLQQSERSNDHFLLGMAYYGLNFTASHEAATEEDPDQRKEKLKQAIRFAEKSVGHFLLVRRYDWVGWVHPMYLVDNYRFLAELETSLEGKRALLKRAVEVGRKGSEYGQVSGSPDPMFGVFHALSKAIFFLSETETSSSEKKKLLEEALELREKVIKILAQLSPPYGWDLGISHNYLALIKADLARMEKDEEKKRRLLEEAVSDMEKCLEICTKYLQTVAVSPAPSNFAFLGWYHDWFGEILDQLYSLTRDEKVINRAIEVCQSAAQAYQKAGMPSRVAEAYWKAARLYNQQGEYIKASDNFGLASKNYQLVAEKIPQLKDFCQDQALYLQAWSEIEKGRHHHARQEYGSAREHYEKAAALHKSLRKWSYLAPNYSAWTQVESAEDLSRREQSEEAIRAFEQAAKLFTETRESLQAQFSRIEDADEKQMATSIVEATDLRREYCIARMALEEARILDKKGDHYSSSEKYGSAAKTFEKITQALESEQDRKEFRLIATLSRAWQKMTQAEAETSPTLYMEASQLFEEAKELSPNEKAKTLALGHSRFCRALEAGTKFADTGDAALHAAAVQHLETAAKYYVRAGFQNASEYAKATELLFDAYVHMDNAKKETDPEKKTKLYTITEKVLQTSAGSYMKAEHPEKREQVLRLLDKVKEERELALSISEVLHAPTIISATTAFSSPTPTQENAVGLERFEHADIQANVITRQKELKIGENLDLEIELVNAGKGPALLIKLAEVIPEGFELTERPGIYRVEDSYLNMKGKRLDPLKTEEVRLILKPKVQGTFALKPRILYLDEDGKYKSHEPEPITITVRELGIKGWLKGER